MPLKPPPASLSPSAAERKLTPALTAQLGKALARRKIARIVFNNEIVWNSAAPEMHFGGAEVKPPPYAFLQATAAGEAALQQKILALAKGAKNIADLFAGLGTFTLPLARHARVHAVEQDGRRAGCAGRRRARHARGSSPSPPKSATCSSCR